MKPSTTAAALLLNLTVLHWHPSNAETELAYIGTRGQVAGDPSPTEAIHGIYAIRLDTDTGQLTPLGLQAELERAMWLKSHPDLPILYAAASVAGESVVLGFAIDRTSGQLAQRDQILSGGAGATYLELDRKADTLFAAHFGSGDVTALPVSDEGALGDVVSSQKQYGTGPHRRQSAPHAHGIAVASSQRHVLATDFGADRIFIYEFDRAAHALTPAAIPYESLPAGAGPRHLLFDAKGKFLYVDTELSAEVRVYRWNERKERLQLVQTLAAFPDGYAGDQKSAGGIVMSRDGRFVYVCLRGDQDSVVAYAVQRRTGTLQEIQRMPAGGKSPWSIGIDPSGRWLLATNEASNTVSVLGIDRKTGRLTASGMSVSIPKPIAVAFDSSGEP